MDEKLLDGTLMAESQRKAGAGFDITGTIARKPGPSFMPRTGRRARLHTSTVPSWKTIDDNQQIDLLQLGRRFYAPEKDKQQ